MEYKVERDKEANAHYVMGLKDDLLKDSNTMLLVRYKEGDCDVLMTNKKNMHSALYDLLQTNDDLEDGDTFITEYGKFVVDGFHVVEASE